MIELYNKDNLKVYVDSDEYKIFLVNFGNILLLTNYTSLEIRLSKRNIANCSVTIMGNTVTIYETTSIATVADITSNMGYNIVLRGSTKAVDTTFDPPVKTTYTLQDSSSLTSYILAGAQIPPEYILQDRSFLSTIGGPANAPIEVYLYNESSCEIDGVDVVISAYDNTKVKTLEDVRNVTASMYDNSSITTYRDTVVTINDESKITRINYP